MAKLLILLGTILSTVTLIQGQTPTTAPSAVIEPKEDSGLISTVVIITGVIILIMVCVLGCSIRLNKKHCCRTCKCETEGDKKKFPDGDNFADDDQDDDPKKSCCQSNPYCQPISPTQQDNCQFDNSCQLCGCCKQDPLAQPFCCFDSLCACDPKNVDEPPATSDDAKCQDECKC